MDQEDFEELEETGSGLSKATIAVVKTISTPAFWLMMGLVALGAALIDAINRKEQG